MPFRATAADVARPVTFRHLERYFGDVNVTQTSFDNFQGHRSEKLARQDIEPRVILTVSTGPYYIEQSGRSVQSAHRTITPWWSLDAFRTRAQTHILAHSVTVSLSALGLPYLLLRDLVARDLRTSPMAALVAQHLTSLAALPHLDEEKAALLAQPTVDLLRAFFATVAGHDSRGAAMGTRVMLYLHAHATDPDLSADKVAAELGISRRSLYALLAKMDVSLGDWVMLERLKIAARRLESPVNALVPIATIARESGFADHSSFSRAFKNHFGGTPSEWRARHGARPPA